MQGFKIHCLVASRNYLMVVFHTDEKCWQFRIATSDGSVLGEQKLYYTAEAAEAAARRWFKV
jgi:hypothetical protein